MNITALRDILAYIELPDGSAEAFPLGNLDFLQRNTGITSVHAGIRIGVSVVMCGVLFLVTPTQRSLLFILYQLNFLWLTLSSSLLLACALGFPSSITSYMLEVSSPPYDRRLAVAESVLQAVTIFSLLACLHIQIYVAFSDRAKREQVIATALAVVASLPCYLFWLWSTILVGIYNYSPQLAVVNRNGNVISYRYVFRAAWPSFAAASSFCSLVLSIKLWAVHRHRAKLGLEKFDPVRVVGITTIQNSVLSAILAIVSSAFTAGNFGAQTVQAVVIPLTAVLLPSGYIWAQIGKLRSQCGDSFAADTKGPALHRQFSGQTAELGSPYEYEKFQAVLERDDVVLMPVPA